MGVKRPSFGYLTYNYVKDRLPIHSQISSQPKFHPLKILRKDIFLSLKHSSPPKHLPSIVLALLLSMSRAPPFALAHEHNGWAQVRSLLESSLVAICKLATYSWACWSPGHKLAACLWARQPPNCELVGCLLANRQQSEFVPQFELDFSLTKVDAFFHFPFLFHKGSLSLGMVHPFIIRQTVL